MNLIKKNIHMDCQKNKAVNQITLEEDFNISDSKPDIAKIIFDNAKVQIDEIKGSGDHVGVRGKLLVSVLYGAQGSDEVIAGVNNEIPFFEEIYMEDLQSDDMIDCKWEMDDLTIGIINSRKVSVRSVISITLKTRSLYDEEAGTELYGDEPVEYRKKMLDIAQVAVCKKDIYRIRQEVEFPSNLPNIQKILWNSIQMGNLEFKALDGKVSLQGELNAFFFYEGEGEENPIRWYETTIPFSGTLDCNDCREMMIPDIVHKISHEEIEVRPDFDGEERVVGLEVVLDLDIKFYEEEQVEILADVYGVENDIKAVTVMGNFKSLLVRNSGKCKVSDRIKIKSQDAKILQLVHSEGEAFLEETRVVEDGLEVNGSLLVKCLYVTGDDKMPYYSLKETLPFTYKMDVNGIDSKCSDTVSASVEVINLTMVDGEEIEAKAVINIQGTVFREKEEEMVSAIEIEDLDMDKIKSLPGMVIYVVKDGDTLWQIGKKYYVPVKTIKEMNGLSSDECRPGEKLLIVKGIQK